MGDVRARVANQGFTAGQAFSLRRRKVPMMERNDGKPARDWFSSEQDYIILLPDD